MLVDARTHELEGNHAECIRLLRACRDLAGRLFRSCVAARGMYATNAKLRNHISAIAPAMQAAYNELNEMIDIEPSTANIRKMANHLSQITFIPDDEKVKTT